MQEGDQTEANHCQEAPTLATIQHMALSSGLRSLESGCPRCGTPAHGLGDANGPCPLATLSLRARPLSLALLLVLPLLLAPRSAETLAYIDPGLGAMLMQLAVGAFFGLLFYLRSVRQYVARLFGRAKDRSE